MDTQSPVLYWEMYGPHTAVVLNADVNDEGYRLMLRHDGALVLSQLLTAGDALFRVSSDLRTHLQQAGFRTQPLPDRAPVLSGGPCWGPATPIHSSLVNVLNQSVSAGVQDRRAA